MLLCDSKINRLHIPLSRVIKKNERLFRTTHQREPTYHTYHNVSSKKNFDSNIRLQLIGKFTKFYYFN